MADTKLSALTELAATPAVDDEVYIRDVSEAAADESKRITTANLLAVGALGASAWVIASDASATIKTHAQKLQSFGYPVWVCDWKEILVSNCETAWVTKQGANVVCTADADHKVGTYSAKMAVAAAAAVGLLATKDFSAISLADNTHILLWLKSSVAIAANDLKLHLSATAACGGAPDQEVINLPALVAATWTQVTVALANPASDGAIISVGVEMAVDKGVFDLYVDDVKCREYDDQVEIQAAIDGLPTGGGRVVLSEGTYVMAAQLTWSKDNVWLRGSGREATVLDFGSLNANLLCVTGSGLEPADSSALLSANVAAGDSTVTLAAGGVASLGLVAGDIIGITSDEVWSGTIEVGELQKIKSIAGEVLTLEEDLFDGYLVADNAAVRKGSFVTGTKLSDFKVVGDGAATSQRALYLYTLIAPVVENIGIEDTIYNGLGAYNWFGGSISDLNIEGVNQVGLGYGITFMEGSRDITVRDCLCRNGRKFGDHSGHYGIPRLITWEGNHIDNMLQSAFAAHAAELITIVNNTVSKTGNHGIFGIANSKIIGNTITDCAGGIRLEASNNCSVINNTIIRCGSATTFNGIDVYDQCTGIRIRGNTLINCTNSLGMRVIASGCTIVGNNLLNSSAISIIANDRDISNITIQGNYVNGEGNSGYGIQTSRTGSFTLERLSILDNTVINFLNRGISIQAESDVIIRGNHSYDADGVGQDYGLALYGAMARGLIIDNNFSGNTVLPIFYDAAFEPTDVRIYDQYSDLFMDVLAVSATAIRSNEDLSEAIPNTFTLDAQPDVPRTLSGHFDTHAQITAYTIVITGVDAKGNTVTETFTEAASPWDFETVNAYATVTSIIMTARTGTGAGDTMDIGITDVLGLSNIIYETGDVYKIKKNNANVTVVAGDVDTTYDTYDMHTITLAATDDFTIWFRSNLNIVN